ncbi:MAG: DUF47 family protein [Propionibacteriaceae bacterium]|nr:DUF47 family protein [Propionibacteriaceae bacterium]
MFSNASFSFRRRRPKSPNFYQLLIAQSQVVHAAVDALVQYCAAPTQEGGDRVKELEREADQARRRLVDEINRTFITPIDREDLFRLSTSLDDLADYAWTTINDMRIYEVTPDEHCLAMAEVLREMAAGLVTCCQDLEKNKAAVADTVKRVKKLENKVNRLFHHSVNSLFDEGDLKKILKYREIYGHLNHASDRGDATADILSDIIVKF